MKEISCKAELIGLNCIVKTSSL